MKIISENTKITLLMMSGGGAITSIYIHIIKDLTVKLLSRLIDFVKFLILEIWYSIYQLSNMLVLILTAHLNNQRWETNCDPDLQGQRSGHGENDPLKSQCLPKIMVVASLF